MRDSRTPATYAPGPTVAAIGVAALLTSATAAAQPPSAATGDADRAILLDRPMRAIHISGNWGTNREVVDAWNSERSERLVPLDYVAWLQGLRVNWVGISVALHYDDSMDSTVERVYSHERQIPTFSDQALRQLIREFRDHGFDVYLTLAFESHEAERAERPVNRGQLGRPTVPDYGPQILPEHWPWLPSHPDHERFVREFWRTYTDQAVHYARIAQAEGVRMYSLGTETDSLVRSRSGGDYWVNDFHDELRTMVESVRAEYDGLLTYDMLSLAIVYRDFFVGSRYLWEDLDLDVVGLSGGFALTDTPPDAVMSVESLERGFDEVFTKHLLPLAADNPGRPIVFTEYYAMDAVETPADPSNNGRLGEMFVFSDSNGNGVDDGRETQANVFRAFFKTMMERHPGVVNGAFFWDNWIASGEHWQVYWARTRNFSIRDKPAEEVVRSAYARMAGNSSPVAVGEIPPQSVTANRFLLVNIAPYFVDPESDPLTYTARSSDAGVVRVGVTGPVLRITAAMAGDAAVDMTASDGRGWATQTARILSCAPDCRDCPPTSFSDHPIRPGSTRVKAVHFVELRSRIDTLRMREGLQTFAWTDPTLTPGATAIRRIHVTELRTALEALYVAAGRARPAAEPVVTAGDTVIRAAHLMELRAAVLTLEASVDVQ